jgi:hypothetical protein
MLVYGAKGRKSPYVLKIITQLQLGALFLSSKINLKPMNKLKCMPITGLLLGCFDSVLFNDAASN